MKRTLILLATIAMSLLPSTPVWAWGQAGHRIIAQVAYSHLSSKARKQVDNLLGTHGVIYWANWPDEIKSDTIYPESIRDGWHYQDLDAGLTDQQVIETLTHYPAEGGNLFRALDSLQLEIINHKFEINPHTMRFIVHLTGDRFCPMHMAHMDDKGGNAVRMKWFGRDTNLHSVWDGKLIESQGYSYTEYAQFLEDTYGDRRREIEKASWEDLTLQTYHLTSDIYNYQTTWDGNTYHYIYRWHQPMEYQLYCAGIRLAQLINSIFK